MLLIEVAKIPNEGMVVATGLDAGEIHVEGERSFTLRPGGWVDCRIERGDDRSVHVRGRLSASLGLDCGRCLDTFDLALDQELDLFYLPHRPDDREEAEDEVELSDRDVVVAYYRGERFDLGEALREQLFLALPMRRLCREDCRGLCLVCGRNRNQGDCGCASAPQGDERLGVLARLIEKGPA
jgi:uncharacterized protein